ncbi:MAG: hypothetical protein JJV88_00105 [Sulfurovum sp.]|nr:hypothetical protein [Sulfurovaceae bacterium]
MKNLKIAFFTEAGSSRGMGHLVRCYTIANGFKKITPNVDFFLDSDIIFDDNFTEVQYFKWKTFTIEKSYDIIFIDSYEATMDIYNTIAGFCKVPVYVDDFKRLEYPQGTILNFAPDAQELFYKQKEEKYHYLLGLDYIPIRNRFLDLKIDKKEQIFIMLGGSDIANLSLKLINILKDIPIKKVLVSNNKEILDNIKTYNNVELLYKPSDIQLIQTMGNSLMAISTASMTTYELAYLKIPTLAIAIAKNQEQGVAQLHKNNIIFDWVSLKNSSWQEEIKEKTKQLLNTIHSIKITNNIDGNGTKNIINTLLESVK